jgi:rubrerythrin
MNAKKERELFASSLERHLEEESRMVEEYRALTELVDDAPAGLLLFWVITEEEAHEAFLRTIIKSLKQAAEKKKGNGADSVGMERDKVLRWIDRLRLKERALVADCQWLKSQASWEDGDLIGALLDGYIIDSEKHQRFLRAVEKMVKV